MVDGDNSDDDTLLPQASDTVSVRHLGWVGTAIVILVAWSFILGVDLVLRKNRVYFFDSDVYYENNGSARAGYSNEEFQYLRNGTRVHVV